MMDRQLRPVRVTKIEQVTPRVKQFTLECAEGGRLPAWSGGSHITIKLTDGEQIWRNSYSLTGTPGETEFYRIAVRREEPGRSKGGSRFLHERVRPGDVLEISAPGNYFPLARHGRKHLLIAGGIGITPFLAQMATLQKSRADYELHYAFRDRSDGPFWEQICGEHGPHVRFYVSSEGVRLSPSGVLARQPLGTHLYICGPHTLISAVSAAAAELGWPSSHVHFEEFAPPPISETSPFKVTLPELDMEITVGIRETILEALERGGVKIASSCRVGQCGTCEMRVLAGDPDHRDRCLSEGEMHDGKIIACVSRSRGERLTLALPGQKITMSLLLESKPLPSLKNSPEAIRRFPFPFATDSYGYSVNLVPAGQGSPGAVDEHLFDIDEHYPTEMAERKRILAEDYERRYLTLPHMMDAQWDFLEMGMTHLAAGYPQHFTLNRDGDRWTWQNHLLEISHQFTFGDPSTLPQEPLEWIGRQMQGDFCLLDQREGDLYLDAGLVTFPADWSLAFDLGMTFEEWHGPVPLAHPAGVFTRAKKFLMNLEIDQPWLRLNWTFTINPRLDTAPEIYHLWGRDKPTVTAENAGEKVHLRVEVQVLARLPRSHGVLFSIRTYLIRLDELATNVEWAKRLRRVLQSLPVEIAEYKGLTAREAVITWLTPYETEQENLTLPSPWKGEGEEKSKQSIESVPQPSPF